MKLAAMAMVVLSAAPFLGAQSIKKPPPLTKPYETVKVTTIESTMAYEPGAVAIRGENLDLILRAQINGIPAPILRRSGTLILIRPKSQEPGFAKLELLHSRGTIQAAIEFMPTLRAWERRDGMRLTLHGGEPGSYWLYYSLDLRPAPVVHPGVYYYEMLDMSSRYSGLFAKGVSDGSPLEFFVSMPPDVALMHPIHVQALCLYADAVEYEWSYSNAYTML